MLNESPFKELVQLEGGIFNVQQTEQARSELMLRLSDNVFQNLEYMSYKSYDGKNRFAQSEMSRQEKQEDIDEMLAEPIDKQNRMIARSLDKILIRHRNTKLFMLLMSGPVLITLKLVWYVFKFLILYLIFKPKAKDDSVTSEAKPPEAKAE